MTPADDAHTAGPDDQCANPNCSRCWGPNLLARTPADDAGDVAFTEGDVEAVAKAMWLDSHPRNQDWAATMFKVQWMERARVALTTVAPILAVRATAPLREKAEWWERTCEYWHDQTKARERTIALLEVERDEARAEVDSLRAEVERLRGAASDIERLTDTYTVEGTEIVLNRMHDLRRERDRLRVTLAAVGDVLDRWDRKAYWGEIKKMQDELRAILAVDPVSLADVRTNRVDTIRQTGSACNKLGEGRHGETYACSLPMDHDGRCDWESVTNHD